MSSGEQGDEAMVWGVVWVTVGVLLVVFFGFAWVTK
jgi:hypothetical protein